mmetsp:Transcript_23172/g.55896  ORF Transcript_23172/g.55896 Transcript_23172/m.55896 type:complete len:224 (-) Transcript_23172:66-737(-)
MKVEDILNYLVVLLGSAEAQDWMIFEEFALSSPQTFNFKTVSKAISEIEDFNGMTLLHACVRYNPPASLLQQMIEHYPQALMKVDCLGRTPLHVASGCGASLPVLELLTMGYPGACNVQDKDGKTPLHFACDASCELFEEDECMTLTPPSIETVCVLLQGSRDAVVLEDLDEMNALECAILSDAPIEVVKLLQDITQRVIRKKSAKANSSRLVCLPACPMPCQ